MSFKRKTIERKPRQLYRLERVPAPVVFEFVQAPKDEPIRSPEYRRYVAGFPCFACGKSGCQAAHSNSPIHGKGGALKADDRNIFPLCATQPFRVGCHDQHDVNIEMTKEERRAIEAEYVARMHAIAVADGWNIETLTRAT